MTIWVAFLAFIIYSFLKSYFRRNTGQTTGTTSGPGPRPGGSGWFPWGNTNDGGYRPTAPPPPPPYSSPGSYSPSYSKPPPELSPSTSGSSWGSGFLTGAALGGIGTHLFNNRQQHGTIPPPRAATYDWERERRERDPSPTRPVWEGRRPTRFDDNRGEGSSSSGLGEMRRSTGLGGSSVR